MMKRTLGLPSFWWRGKFWLGVCMVAGCARPAGPGAAPRQPGPADLPASPAHHLPTVKRWSQWSQAAPLVRLDYPADWKVQEIAPKDPATVFQVRFSGPAGARFTLSARRVSDRDPALSSEARRRAAHRRGRLPLTDQEKDYSEGQPEAVFVSGNPAFLSTLKFRREGAVWKGLRVTVPLQRHHFFGVALMPVAKADSLRPLFDEMIKSLVLGD